jgi:3-hydroxyisobutyrate dehydrogenase-like beta-hydroxyacid dehydrogenase
MNDPKRLAVAFCGLGRMGEQMARRIVDAGFELTVYNRNAAVAAEFADRTGAAWARTPRDAAARADVVITMLTDGPAVLGVLDGPDGVLAGLAGNGAVVDCSTTGAQYARSAAAMCTATGGVFLDSPVSGSTAVASVGELGLMVGGDSEVLRRVEPVLRAFAKTIVHVGGDGAGAASKVAINGLLHSFNTALAESVVVAERHGVPRAVLFEVLSNSVLSNRYLDYKSEAFVHPENASVAFDLQTASKDLRLAMNAAQTAHVHASLIERALDIHQRAVADGYGQDDISALATWFDRVPQQAQGPASNFRTLERT